MSKRLLYYVSGHGFGHAGRAVAVSQALLAAHPDLHVEFRTGAPAFMFADVLGECATLRPGPPEAGMAEVDPLTIDVPASVERLRAACQDLERNVAAEVAALAGERVDLLLADTPFLTGYVAERLGVPCVAVTNFTWDWICAPLLADYPDGEALLDTMRSGYQRMQALLHLPFGGDTAHFPEVHPVPFLARRTGRARQEAEALLGLAGDSRPRLLLALRGGTDAQALTRAAESLPDTVFLLPRDPAEGLPSNVRSAHGTDLTFDELLHASEAVLSKPGWGILNDCAVARKALLWVPRVGFREDEISVPGTAQFIPTQELPRTQYEAGDWAEPVGQLLARTFPSKVAETYGAALCAQLLEQWL